MDDDQQAEFDYLSDKVEAYRDDIEVLENCLAEAKAGLISAKLQGWHDGIKKAISVIETMNDLIDSDPGDDARLLEGVIAVLRHLPKPNYTSG